MDSTQAFLRKIPLFEGLTLSEFRAVKSCLRHKSFDKGEVLTIEGEPCSRIFVVETGQIKLYRIASSGREQILETLGPGDTCACNPGIADWQCGSTAEAITSCRVWFLSRENYVHLAKSNSKVSQSLNRIFAKRLQCFGALIEEVSLKDVKKRIVKFLLDMSDQGKTKTSDTAGPQVCFTQEEIARRLGCSRETVSRYLSLLKRGKLIDIKSRNILVLQKNALKKILS